MVVPKRLLEHAVWHQEQSLKGIVSRDFEWLQTILMNRLCVPDVPLEVYSFLNSHLHTVFKFLSLQRVKLLLRHLAKA